MTQSLIKIDNPIYSTLDEIEELYWENWLLLTNIKRKDNDRGIEGGVVRYLSDKCKPLFTIMSKLDSEPDKYGDSTVFYLGDKVGGLGGLFI